jgi:hypothetical protein
MKKTKKIRTEQTLWIARYTILIGIVLGLCISNLPLTSHAQGHSNYFNNYHGMAYIAEQEIRSEQQKAAARNEHYKTDTANNNIVEDKVNEEERSNECSVEMQREAVDC